MPRIYTPLTNEERSALVELAKRERRDPRQQAAYLIRQCLVDAGLLKQQLPALTEAAGQPEREAGR